jgi:hypothetical protein
MSTFRIVVDTDRKLDRRYGAADVILGEDGRLGRGVWLSSLLRPDMGLTRASAARSPASVGRDPGCPRFASNPIPDPVTQLLGPETPSLVTAPHKPSHALPLIGAFRAVPTRSYP